MSTQDESGVYYTPSLGFPNHHPDSQNVQQHPGCSQDALKQCSVKGCTETLTADDTNKMCDACRSRHRVYANTKRARRKLEKAAMATAVAARGGKDTEMSLIDHDPQPITWVNAGGQSRQDLRPSTSGSTIALSSLSTWNHAIDPRLFSGDVSPASPHHLPSLMPHQTSTSSELANALTPRNPSTPVSVSTSTILPSQVATDHNKHYHDRIASQKKSSHLQIPPTPVVNQHDDDSIDNEEEQRVIESLQVTPVQDQVGMSSSDRQGSSETAELSQGRSSEEVDGSGRFCSVKGCKAAIPASYEYKMCTTCRTRYRTYGNTKRAKWKAERDAFDREMAALRAVEDEKRKAKGLRPLAESPEDLRAWELSIIDEQVPVVPADNSSVLPEASEPGSTQSLSPSPALIPGMNSPMVVYPPGISSSSTADAISQYQLNNNPILAAAANTSLPARMCTVSHCHKVLPGYYRYKRCEQHRLQNRRHSQLKRVRERVIKVVGPEREKGAALAVIPHEMEVDKDDETMQATVAPTTAGTEGKDADSFSSTTGGGDSESQKKSHDQKRSKFSCSAGDCHNLLLPTVRWRLCESCRSKDRLRKNQIKFQQKAATEKEKMDADSQVGVVSENGHAAVGEAEESQEINHAISAGVIDPDAEGDIDMGENDETEPRAVENEHSFVSPPLPSMPPASMAGGFSRFHVTIDPASSVTSDPKTSTAQLVTLDDPLAFRAYRPKTTPSAIGRILARNPGLSVDAFSEVLQAESASTGVTLSQANATSTTKSIITPTIPTSAPFVYKAPEKKITPTRGTVAKGKHKASSEKQSTSSSTTPATPASVPTTASAVSDSTTAPPGSYGSYGYPQYPYPYPYYMPSPYGMPPYPYSHAPPPAPSEAKQKSSSKLSTTTATSSSSPAQVPPSTAIPGYSPYPYPYPPPPYGYPPPPNGYPYMTTPRYVPGQQPYNGLPPGASGPNSYPYPYFPLPAPTSVSFPKTAAAARERQRAQDTKFNYYHYGAGSSDSPTTPNSKKRKRQKVDSDYIEKFKAQTEAISISLSKNQVKRPNSSSVPTLPPASIASGSSNAAPPVIFAQPVALGVDAAAAADDNVLSKAITLTRPCANKTCNRSIPVDTVNTLCDKCRLRFKKHQAKAKKRFKLEPRKSLFFGKKNISEKRQGSVEEEEEKVI